MAVAKGSAAGDAAGDGVGDGDIGGVGSGVGSGAGVSIGGALGCVLVGGIVWAKGDESSATAFNVDRDVQSQRRTARMVVMRRCWNDRCRRIKAP